MLSTIMLEHYTSYFIKFYYGDKKNHKQEWIEVFPQKRTDWMIIKKKDTIVPKKKKYTNSRKTKKPRCAFNIYIFI